MGVVPDAIPFNSIQRLELAATANRKTWIQIAKVGHWHSGKYGEFDITRTDIAQMHANHKAMIAPTQVPVDYDHLSTNVRQPGDGAAAGWFEDVQIRASGDELWGLVEFTEPAAKRIRHKEYRFISPTFFRNWKDKHTGNNVGTKFVCAAITNHPFIEGMAAVTLSMAGAAGTQGDIAIQVQRKTSTSGDPQMAKSFKVKNAAGEEVEIPESEIVQLDTFKTLQTENATLKEQVKKVPGDGQQVVDGGTLKTLTESVTALTGKVTELSTELSNTKKANTHEAAERKVSDLIRQGKIAADKDTKAVYMELAENTPEQFDKIAKTLKPIIKLNHSHGTDDASANNTSSAVDEMRKLIDEHVKAGGGASKVSTKDALHAVTLANPDLAERYREEMNYGANASQGDPIH